MAVTKVATFNFVNQVRGETTGAYFRRMLIFAAFAWRIMDDFKIKPGNKVDLPFYAKMGAAEKPAEDDRLAVDSLGDKSISCQVYEAAKAWGITDAGRYRKAESDAHWEGEAEAQVAQRLAELVDSDALACLNNDGTNSIDGAAGNDPKGHDAVDKTADITISTVFDGERGINDPKFIAQKMNIRSLTKALQSVFGDRKAEANALLMHSNVHTDILTDQGAGILKADAITPQGAIVKSFMGNLLGRDVFMNDQCPVGPKRTVTDSGGSTQKYQTRKTFMLKPKSFLFLVKQSPKWEDARDILGRIDYSAVTQWYTFYPLHKQNNAEDIRAGAVTNLTEEQTT